MNLIFITQEEVGSGIPAGDPRAIHLIKTIGIQLEKTFFVGIKNGRRGLATLHQLTPFLLFSVCWEKEVRPLLPLELIVGLPRPQTAKKILYEAACLGVNKIIFFVSEKGDPGYLSSSLWKNNEWEEFLAKGAEQACACGIPEIIHVASLGEVFPHLSPASWRIALDPYTATESLSLSPTPQSFGLLAIGPERGWSEAERIILARNNFVFKHLGERVLRVETACTVGIALMLSQLNKWKPHRPLEK